MKSKKLFFISIFFVFFNLSAQNNSNQLLMRAIIYQGDTLPYMALDTIKYYYYEFKGSNKEYIAYTKLVRDVKKAYPYAKLISNKVNEINKYLNSISNSKQLEKEKDRLEKELRVQYEKDIKNLTRTQGKILIKLIYRETKKTSYNLIKDYRGGFLTSIYQGLAKIFGLDLKETYDPNGKDRNIEIIVTLIENGQL
jgi:protein subunit release factor A